MWPCDDVPVPDTPSQEALDAIMVAVPASDRDHPAELLDVGFSSVVVALGGSIVRIARTRQAREGHEREARLLPWLDDYLGVALPVPLSLISPSGELPFGAIVQPRLPGRAMTAGDGLSVDLCGEFGRLLARLHGLDHTAAPSGSLQHLDPIPHLRRIQRETDEWLRTRLTASERTQLASRLDRAEAVLPNHEQVLCHGDAWYGNVMVDDGKLVALLDFEDACVADAALDLAASAYLDQPGSRAVLDAYLTEHPATPSLNRRIDDYLLLRELAGLAYVLRNNISEEFGDSVEKIRFVLAR